MPKSKEKDPDPKKPASPAKPPRKRRWRRRLLITFGVLLLLGALAEGPGARWLIHKVAIDQLAKLGMSGDLEVDGHLLGGFTLHKVSFSGEDNYRTLKLASVGVSYTVPGLIDKRIDRVHAHGVEVDLTLGPKKEKEDKPKKTFAEWGELLRKIHGFAAPVELDLRDLDIALTLDSGKEMEFVLGGATHASDAPEWAVRGFGSNVLGEDGLPVQDIDLTWTMESLALTRTEVVPGLAVGSLAVDFPDGSPISLAGLLEVAERELSLTANQDGSISIELQEGPLDLAKIELPGEVELGGLISRLTIHTHDLLIDPDDWRAEIDADVEAVSWGKGSLDAATVDLDVNPDSLQLDVKVGSDIHLVATGPHPDLGEQPTDWRNGTRINYELVIGSLHSALDTTMAAIGKEALDHETLPEGTFRITGDLQTGGERFVAQAKTTWSLADLVYRGQDLPALEGTAGLEGESVSFQLDLAEPEGEEKLNLTALLDLESMAYDGSAEINFPDTAWLRGLVPLEGEEWKPTGALALTWKGNGDLREATHKGEARVDPVAVTAPAESTVEASLGATYQWPERVDLTTLRVRNGKLTFEGQAGFADKRVTVTGLRVHDETGDLATLDANAPVPAGGATLKEFLASDESVALRLKADQLRVARLADLFPLKLPDGLACALSADFDLSGTLANPVLDGDFRVDEFKLESVPALPPLSALIDFDTLDGRLAATTTVSDPDKELLTLKASLPLEIQACIDDPNRIFTLPLGGSFTLNDINLAKFRELSPGLENLGGTVSASLDLGNTINAPTVNGKFTAKALSITGPDTVAPIDVDIELKTTDGLLAATGKLTEPTGEIVSLNASFPLEVEACLDDPDHFSTLPIQAQLQMQGYQLKRLAFLSSKLQEIDASLDVNVEASGTVGDPGYSGTMTLQVDRIPLPNSPFREIRNSKLEVLVQPEGIEIVPSTVTVAGGTLTLGGNVSELTGGETFDPVFDLRLDLEQTLLWRNTFVTARGNGGFTLKGPLSKAAVAGELRIVESLFYKDIEIIPMRISATAAPKPSLPKLDKREGNPDSLPVPPPVGDWTLDLHIFTPKEEPLIISGNLAKGKVTADVKIGGTVSKPRPSGAVKLRKLEAGLPFSTLKIDKGSVVMRPNRPFDPVLDIRGESQAGSYQVNIYISGSASNPKFTLNSFPPLPESEILTLLATGTTTSGLEDTDLAQMKALQFFIDDMRRKAEAQGGNPRLEAILGILDNVDLRVGDNDPFRGQQWNSATLEISQRWYLSAAFDREGNSRGTVIYSLRFR